MVLLGISPSDASNNGWVLPSAGGALLSLGITYCCLAAALLLLLIAAAGPPYSGHRASETWDTALFLLFLYSYDVLLSLLYRYLTATSQQYLSMIVVLLFTLLSCCASALFLFAQGAVFTHACITTASIPRGKSNVFATYQVFSSLLAAFSFYL